MPRLQRKPDPIVEYTLDMFDQICAENSPPKRVLLEPEDFIPAWMKRNVPPEVKAIQLRGGPNAIDMAWLFQDNSDGNQYSPMDVIARADECLMYPKTKEIAEKSYLVLRKTVALMAFAPGGIRIFGYRFCSEIDGFVDKDES